MKSILHQLYNGELNPYAKFKPTIEEYKLNRNKAFESYSNFLEKLPDNYKEEFTTLIDNHIYLLSFELEQNFIDGFITGVRMMTEIFWNNSDED